MRTLTVVFARCRRSFPFSKWGIGPRHAMLTIPLLLVSALLLESAMAQESAGGGEAGAEVDREAERRAFKADVLEWVDELDSPTLRVRKEAERALIEAGPEALSYLPGKNAVLSLEKSERLSRVRTALEAMRAKADVDTESTRIRLNKVANLGEALAAITQASGIQFQHNADPTLPVNPVETPLAFWHALDIVLDETDLDVNFYGGDSGVLQLDKRDAKRPSRVDSAAYVGVYRLEASSVASRRNLRRPELNGLDVGVEISWEPRLTPIGLNIPLGQLSGKLNDGAVLNPQTKSGSRDVATNNAIAFSEVYFPLQLPAGQPSSISALSGVIKALLPGEKKSFELLLAEPNAKKKIDAMTVQIESVRRDGPLHEIRVAVELEKAGRSLESHRHWIFENDVSVKRKDGTTAPQLGFEVYRQTESGVGVGYLFDIGDDVGEWTLVYKSPTSVLLNEVPFVIQDIPLP